MLDQKNTTAGQIVDTLMEKLGKSQCELFGGDLLEIASYLDPLYLKQEQQVRAQDGGNFTEQMYSIADSLLKCDLVWGEIPSNAARYDVSSQILQSIDKVGFQFLRQNIGTFNFTFNSLAVTLKNESTDKNSWSCFEFPWGSYDNPIVQFRHERGVKDGGPLGKICIPNVAYNNTVQGLSVSSALQFNNREGLIFPLFSNDPQTNLSTIIGLSIDNKTHVDLPSGSPTVQITFYQVCQIFDAFIQVGLLQEYFPSISSCGFWNMELQEWSQEGCKLNVGLSNRKQTVCECDHLTSFNLMMDFTGEALPYPDLLTNILLPISIISLILCEALNSFESTNKESQEPLVTSRKHRRRVERLRNLSLCAGQLCWLMLPDLASRLPQAPPMLCQACSALTHLVWMLFWSYAGAFVLLFFLVE